MKRGASFILRGVVIAWAIVLMVIALFRAITNARPLDPETKYVRIYDVHDLADRWIALHYKDVVVSEVLPSVLFQSEPEVSQHLRPGTHEEIVNAIVKFIQNCAGDPIDWNKQTRRSSSRSFVG
jgi:hypothetical protein